MVSVAQGLERWFVVPEVVGSNPIIHPSRLFYTMARLIGLDYGKKRIGIAITDPLQLIASPLKTLKPEDILSFLQRYLEQEQVEGIVVGRPVDLQARATKTTYLVDQFVLTLKRCFNVPVFTIDERFTSVISQASLLEGGFKKKTRRDKAVLDAISATFILRSFLSLQDKLIKA